MSISNKNISIIKKSSGLIEKNADKIAKTMYIMLFNLYPNYKVMFEGAPSNQHELLAETISAYAINVNNIDIFKPALLKIAKTHVCVGVKPEHYKAIHKMLLLSFKVVLMEKATDEIINAWDEAIIFVANKLIEIETKLYEEL